MTDVFECYHTAEMAYSDSLESWPLSVRQSMQAMIGRLLAREPDKEVESSRSYCIGRDHPRFATACPASITHCLVHEVTLRKKAAA